MNTFNIDFMLSDLDNYYLQHPEPTKSCLLALKEIILAQDKEVSAAWKYRMPCFCYKGKMFCYLWTNKITGQPYILFVEGKHLNYPELIQEKRSRMKILLIDPDKDLPVKFITKLLDQAIDLYKTGIIPIRKV
jgi:hypothetical protein